MRAAAGDARGQQHDQCTADDELGSLLLQQSLTNSPPALWLSQGFGYPKILRQWRTTAIAAAAAATATAALPGGRGLPEGAAGRLPERRCPARRLPCLRAAPAGCDVP